ncbi:Ni/Fe hydrogenase subunit alpha [Desulfuromonas sp. TF]|uniref:Ni/Fe hydrogenase subunit alpha n=1 Tax=Desulfuromonas sp. TF TaxID=1232410 RepID=UPI00040C6154|nr:nickel-dependent hydrogenase large subunit [Desulfuromonas sp. TF]
MRTVRIEPLTRVEGHGRVELQIRGGRLAGARIAITESPRLFEGLLLGRSLFEVPALICRICAICSAVHRVVSCQALEKALGVTIPPQAARIRELLVLGGHIESHALHLFCLILPDLEGTASILDLLRKGSAVAREGLALKSLGNRIQEAAGGRVIHPINVEVGGVLRRPDEARMYELLADMESWKERLFAVAAPFSDAARFPASPRAVGTRIAVRGDAGFSLMGEDLALSDGRIIPVGEYRELLREYPVPYSNARHSREGETPFLASALSRLELAGDGEFAGGIHGNNAAQAAELSWVLARAGKLIREILEEREGELRVPVQPGPGIGTAAIEAPRGLLIHHYGLDDMGRVAAADIVTPTAINQAAMEAQLLADLEGVVDEAELEASAERIVRAFDPCISCSVHLLRLG